MTDEQTQIMAIGMVVGLSLGLLVNCIRMMCLLARDSRDGAEYRQRFSGKAGFYGSLPTTTPWLLSVDDDETPSPATLNW